MSETAYIFDGSLYCEPCGERLIRRLIREGAHPPIDCRNCRFKGEIGRKAARRAFDRRNGGDWLKCPKCLNTSATFDDMDSDTWPHREGGGESDSIQHCDSSERCIGVLTFDGVKVGAWLGNDLTREGIRDSREMLATPDGSEFQKGLHAFWRCCYSCLAAPEPSDDS